MELKEFTYVVTIADEGSISRAADKLFMAQSSLSQYLNRLETDLGSKLFVRTAGGVRPTLSGEIYIRNARQMLNQYRLVKTEVRDLSRPTEGRIEFGISSFRGEFLIPKAMVRFREIAPAVEVVFHEMDSIPLHRSVSAGQLDIALVAYHDEDWHRQGKRIKRDEVVIVANRAHPVMQYVKTGQGGPSHPWVDLRDIGHFEFLLSNPSTKLGHSAKQLFEKAQIQPRYTNANLTAAFSAAMARQGLGLAFTYRSCAAAHPDAVYLSIGPVQYYVNLVLLYPSDGYRSRAVRLLEETIRQTLYEEE